MNQHPLGGRSDIVVQNLDNETLVYDLNNNKAFCLNETAGLVWNLCDGERTISEIAERISRETGQVVTEELVGLTPGELTRNGLLAGEQKEEETFDFLTRREAIRRVGFTSAIALPLVSAVIAPTALMVQSGGVALLGACSTDTDCQAGLFCRFCGSTSCPQVGPTCCATGYSPQVGPGFDLDGPTDQPGCDLQALSGCCSGTATFVAPNSCICD